MELVIRFDSFLFGVRFRFDLEGCVGRLGSLWDWLCCNCVLFGDSMGLVFRGLYFKVFESFVR